MIKLNGWSMGYLAALYQPKQLFNIEMHLVSLKGLEKKWL
jgi:hypothetical protein